MKLNSKVFVAAAKIIIVVGLVLPGFAYAQTTQSANSDATTTSITTSSKAKKTATNSLAAKNSPLMEGLTMLQSYLGLSNADPRSVASKLIKVALGFVGPLFFIIVLYSGFLWMISGGDDEKVSKAKRTFFGAIVGVVIMLSAYSIVLFVMRGLGVN